MRRTLTGIALVVVLPLSGPGAYAKRRVGGASESPARFARECHAQDSGTNVTGRLVELREDAVVMRENATDRAHTFRLPSGATLRDAVPFARADVSQASLVEMALPYRPATSGDTAIVKRVVGQ